MFQFEELDNVTRGVMLHEFRAEQGRTDLTPFRPAGLTRAGHADYIAILEQTIESGDEESLLAAVSRTEFWDPVQRDRSGREGRWPVEKWAARFAYSEFNTWYVRGVARRLTDEGVDTCEIYRAAPAYKPRPECIELESQVLSVRAVYEGHRAKYHPPGNPEAFSIPVGPNCHHTIRRRRLA